MDLNITAAAQKFIQRMVRFSGVGAEAGFRLVVSPGGCSGLNSEFSVEAAPRVGDAVVEAAGLKLFLPAESRLLLAGATVDFADTPTQSGLVFHQPGGHACGCSSGTTEVAPGVSTVDVTSITRKH